MATAREVGEGVLKPENRKFLFGYAMRLTKNRDDAQDLVQETILRALSSAHLFQAGTKLHAWMATIMKNTFVNAKRRKSSSPVEYSDADYPVEADQDSTMMLEAAAGILESLSKDVTGMLLAKVVEGRKEKDIARDFGIPVGTVKSRISRAREALKARMLA